MNGFVRLLHAGRIFNVGDRITAGGVRGDVIALGFMQTTIMEMGRPPLRIRDAAQPLGKRMDNHQGGTSEQ